MTIGTKFISEFISNVMNRKQQFVVSLETDRGLSMDKRQKEKRFCKAWIVGGIEIEKIKQTSLNIEFTLTH